MKNTTKQKNKQSETYLEYINRSVATIVENSSEKIVNKYVDQQVDKEISRRAELLGRLVNGMNQTQKQLEAIVPDVISYDKDGAIVSSNYSKGQYEKRNTLLKRLTLAEEILTDAFSNNVYARTEDVIKELNSSL